MVKVMFRANPKPTSGVWWIGSTEIPTGEIVSYNGKFFIMSTKFD